ncbi:LysM peptidoglycan-binding domain-containing protein, partial [Paraburkholderia sp. LEh10]|uniref:LysM peptidoglycan-binding domain-containing protein n=1 Tax=Paraburkholderia sp. LEh10 TaxID=2821353 RepID=UPI001AEA7FED
MSKSGLHKAWASFASVTLALMLGACAHIGEQSASDNGAASGKQTAADPASATPVPSAPQTVAQPVPPVIYKVRRGDSLARIARSHNVTVKQIVAWNHMKPFSRLHIGQPLKLSSPDAVKMVAVPVSTVSGASGATSVAGGASDAAARAPAGNNSHSN